MTTECTTDGRQQNSIDARINRLVESVSTWSALAVVISNEIAESLPLSQFHQTLALLPVTLAVLYVLLALAVRLEG